MLKTVRYVGAGFVRGSQGVMGRWGSSVESKEGE